MSEAPERIWAEPRLPGYLDEPTDLYTVEYVRADLLPVVKPLVWEGSMFPSDPDILQSSECLGHEYHIGKAKDGWFFFDDTDQEEIGGLSDEKSAIAAADAYNATRIRACLDMIDEDGVTVCDICGEIG